jgi:hypothetical protein
MQYTDFTDFHQSSLIREKNFGHFRFFSSSDWWFVEKEPLLIVFFAQYSSISDLRNLSVPNFLNGFGKALSLPIHSLIVRVDTLKYSATCLRVITLFNFTLSAISFLNGFYIGFMYFGRHRLVKQVYRND